MTIWKSIYFKFQSIKAIQNNSVSVAQKLDLLIGHWT